MAKKKIPVKKSVNRVSKRKKTPAKSTRDAKEKTGSTAKKAPAKKVARKSAARKLAKPARGAKPDAKKKPATTPVPRKRPGRKSEASTTIEEAAAKVASVSKKDAELARSNLKEYTRSKKHTPAVFKLPSRKNTPIVFSLEDVREALKKSQTENQENIAAAAVEADAPAEAAKPSAETIDTKVADKPEHRVLGAASVVDILGFNPIGKGKVKKPANRTVRRKFARYYKMLVALRDHVKSGLDLHKSETLKRSSKEDTGDPSSYGQHMADAGTDTLDRDFALSLVSTEQEALFEIEEAINRVYNGTYGICEITGEPIKTERLEAVPFTRYSLEGQRQIEGTSRKKVKRIGVFLDSSVDATAQFTNQDGDD